MAKDWTRLISSPDTAQFLPYGEVIGAIPCRQPGGAYARSIGLALIERCRRKPREMLAGKLPITRREMIDHFPPALGHYSRADLQRNPQRVVEYWYSGLQYLGSKGLLAAEGDASLAMKGKADIRSAVKAAQEKYGYGWLDRWLDERISLKPGSKLGPAVEACASKLPPNTPKRLGRAKGSRRKARGDG